MLSKKNKKKKTNKKQMPEISWFCRRFSRESRRAGKAMKKPVISGLNRSFGSPAFYVSKLGYIRAWKRVYAATNSGNSDIFACHIENRAYGFLAGVWLQRAVSPLCLDNLGKFGLILIGASDEASMPTSSNNVTILMKSVRYDGLFWSFIFILLKLLWRKISQTNIRSSV